MPVQPNLTEVTIADVARQAGVSVSTVSRILNSKPDVAEGTRARVLDLINSMGFVPHAQARSLAAGTSQTITLLDPVNLSGGRAIDQLHLDFMIGAAAAASEQDFFFNILASSITESRLLDLYRGVQADGVILMEIYQNDWRVKLLRENKFPFVMIGRCADNTGLPFIELDLEAATLAAFEHLHGLGHRHIAYLGFPRQLRQAGYGPAVRGWAGYRQAQRAYRFPRLYRETSFEPQTMAAAVSALLEEQPRLSALVALTDAPLVSAITALRNSGRQVPTDVSVVGLAIDRLAELITPRLTAVRFPSYEMGHRAATILARHLKGEAREVEQILLTPQLVVRDSTAPPP